MGPSAFLQSIIAGAKAFTLLSLPHYHKQQAASVIHLVNRFIVNNGTPIINNTPVISPPGPVYLQSGIHSPSILSGCTLAHTRLLIITLREIDIAWNVLINRCKAEWMTIFNLAVTLVLASLGALQVITGPLTCFFVYFAMFCAISSITCSVTLLIHFHDPKLLTGQFAQVWVQNTRSVEIHHRSPVFTPWATLSLPAMGLCWGSIALVLALISSVWHNTATDGATPQSIGMVPQLIITTLCVADLACVIWISATMKKLKSEIA